MDGILTVEIKLHKFSHFSGGVRKVTLQETSRKLPLKRKAGKKSARHNETLNECKICHVFVSVWKPVTRP